MHIRLTSPEYLLNHNSSKQIPEAWNSMLLKMTLSEAAYCQATGAVQDSTTSPRSSTSLVTFNDASDCTKKLGSDCLLVGLFVCWFVHLFVNLFVYHHNCTFVMDDHLNHILLDPSCMHEYTSYIARSVLMHHSDDDSTQRTAYLCSNSCPPGACVARIRGCDEESIYRLVVKGGMITNDSQKLCLWL